MNLTISRFRSCDNVTVSLHFYLTVIGRVLGADGISFEAKLNTKALMTAFWIVINTFGGQLSVKELT